MEAPFDPVDLEAAENCLIQGEDDAAQAMLERMAEQAEAYVAENCVTTDEVQFFSFPSAFERLAYRRVEQDPRTLVQVDAPLDRMYATLGLVYARRRDWEGAKAAYAQAVRWNPMNCRHRLCLADMYRMGDDMHEWAALSFSVFERASDAGDLACAYANMGDLFLSEGKLAASLGCAELSERCAATHGLRELRRRLADYEDDAAQISSEQAVAAALAEGVPEGANAEIAICLLMCASDAARTGDRDDATRLALRARDLVGEQAARTLMQLINDADAELATEKGEGGEDA